MTGMRSGTPGPMAFDHEEAPVLDALTEYHAATKLGLTPPGHEQARGAEPGAVAGCTTTVRVVAGHGTGN
ncbi:hypothetical protein [Streptomyces griseoluteus]|uniref:hypothetical protein n=1 Tax=Streptomyces griseoluteus TaxID=29306 RepID=UPI0036F5BEF8